VAHVKKRGKKKSICEGPWKEKKLLFENGGAPGTEKSALVEMVAGGKGGERGLDQKSKPKRKELQKNRLVRSIKRSLREGRRLARLKRKKEKIPGKRRLVRRKKKLSFPVAR